MNIDRILGGRRMTVSIIMPFYKGGFFLEDALESLRQQSCKDMEVLLICDRVKKILII